MSDLPPTRWSMTQPVDPRRQTATKPGSADSMADAWEKEKMASIQERYERMRAIIDDWEINKKKKANRKMERIEAKPENKRAEALQSHHEEIKRIEEIAGGARAQAEKNRRKEELKRITTKAKRRLDPELEFKQVGDMAAEVDRPFNLTSILWP
ncbi:UNVERIFIED_CONTAM: hypothetical protein Sradi_6738300 [Sesamum radiatum]|uniref:Remorin C-terminal domain-containing protein n=1 Tax=Sesamum radiatum TaxID=300843 RepID=A0AAW2JQU0_SESRA